MSAMLLTAYDGAILGPIAKLLGWLMNGIYYLMAKIGLGNIGLSIIIFTIIIYMLLFPLTYKQQKFSKLQQKMQPELAVIQKKYKDKKDQASMMAMQEETQALYQKYGVSMMGGCGTMLIQMPLLLALYRVFLNIPAYVGSVRDSFSSLVSGIMSIPGYQDKMTEIMTNLKIYVSPSPDFTATDTTALSNSIIDIVYKLNSNGWETLKETFPSLTGVIQDVHEQVSKATTFLCYNISDTPWDMIKTNFADRAFLLVIAALAIPVISYLTQVLNLKMMPAMSAGGDGSSDQMAKQMQMMNKIMPITSFVLCFTVPVGLGIYWIASAVVRAVQQVILNKHFEKVNLEDIIKKNQEKAKKKRAKMGINENQISNAARIKTKQIAEPANTKEKEAELQKANAMKSNAKSGSMASKANMVKEFNERNSRK